MEEIKQLLKDLIRKYEEQLENLEHERSQWLHGRLKKIKTELEKIGALQKIKDDLGVTSILKLPDEILEMILFSLRDTKDLYSCYRVCTRFKTLLEPRKHEFEWTQVLPHVVNYMTNKDLLKTRVVCKSWRTSLGTVMDNIVYGRNKWDSSLRKEFSRLHGELKVNIRWAGIDIKRVEAIDRFVGEMENDLIHNPFIGRKIRIGGATLDDISIDYWNKVEQVLEQFGNDIWDCEIELEEPPRDGSRSKALYLYRTVRNILVDLRNLKKLNICCSGELRINLFSFEEKSWDKVLQRLEDEPIPRLAHLKELVINDAQADLLNFLFHQMPIEWLQQLTRLRLDGDEFQLAKYFYADADSMSDWFPNLETLELDGFRCTRKNLSRLERLFCPLKKLLISNCYGVKNESDFTSFIPTINHFGEALQHLRIGWERGLKEVDVLSPTYLQACLDLSAPHLKTLELVNKADFLIYLLRLPSLEQLSIVYHVSGCSGHGARFNPFDNVRSEEIIEIHGFTKKMFESNIWDRLPYLNKFLFEAQGQSFQYTRDDYYDFNKAAN